MREGILSIKEFPLGTEGIAASRGRFYVSVHYLDTNISFPINGNYFACYNYFLFRKMSLGIVADSI